MRAAELLRIGVSGPKFEPEVFLIGSRCNYFTAGICKAYL
jgi:hypothetical protein